MLYDPKWEVSSTTKQALTRARALIEDPANWCQTYSNGEAICAVHAIQIATGVRYGIGDPVLEGAALSALGKAMGLATPGTGGHEGGWNDSHTHTEVLAAFDRAIAAA